jgi:hypothetical protein
VGVHIITAHGGSVIYPYIIATEPAQYETLVDLALLDPGLTGTYARSHFHTYLYASNRPVGLGDGTFPRQCLQVGYFARFGGVMFRADPRVPADRAPATEDWAWLALRQRLLADTPAVYFDQESGTLFPPKCVMPMDEVRKVALEFASTGERPKSVRWLTVNDLRWKLDGAGDVVELDG